MAVFLLVLQAALVVDSGYPSFRVDVALFVICDSFNDSLWGDTTAPTLLLHRYGGQGDVENITLKISLQKFYCTDECWFPSCFQIYSFTQPGWDASPCLQQTYFAVLLNIKKNKTITHYIIKIFTRSNMHSHLTSCSWLYSH